MTSLPDLPVCSRRDAATVWGACSKKPQLIDGGRVVPRYAANGTNRSRKTASPNTLSGSGGSRARAPTRPTWQVTPRRFFPRSGIGSNRRVLWRSPTPTGRIGQPGRTLAVGLTANVSLIFAGRDFIESRRAGSDRPRKSPCGASLRPS